MDASIGSRGNLSGAGIGRYDQVVIHLMFGIDFVVIVVVFVLVIIGALRRRLPLPLAYLGRHLLQTSGILGVLGDQIAVAAPDAVVIVADGVVPALLGRLAGPEEGALLLVAGHVGNLALRERERVSKCIDANDGIQDRIYLDLAVGIADHTFEVADLHQARAECLGNLRVPCQLWCASGGKEPLGSRHTRTASSTFSKRSMKVSNWENL